MEGSVRVLRIRNIDIGFHYSWLLIFGLVAFSLATGRLPAQYPGWGSATYWLTGTAASLLLFASVVGHELAHSLVAISRGLPVRSITLFLFGGVSNLGAEPGHPGDELVIAIVGPLASFALAATAFFGLLVANMLGRAAEPVLATLSYLAIVNLWLGLFNLIPGFPLDGGRVFRAVLWWGTNSICRATRIAALVGRAIGFIFIAGGAWLLFGGNLFSGLWLILIGWFLDNAAGAGLRQVVLREHFGDVLVADIMDPSPPIAHPEMRLTDVVEEYLLRRNVRALPVVTDGQVVGMVTLSDVKEVPLRRWPDVQVAEVMGGGRGVKSVRPTDQFYDALQIMAQGDLNQVPVLLDGHLVGLLSRTDMVRYFQVREELGVRRWPGRPFFRPAPESLFDDAAG